MGILLSRSGAPVTQTYRLFIAIELPTSLYAVLKESIGAVRDVVPPDTVRWVKPDAMHLTLKFLGEVPIPTVDLIHEYLQTAVKGHTPFTIEIRGIGCFPNFVRPSVIWLGLENASGQLLSLRNAVEEQIAPLGYPTENRDFSAHLTLGRVKRDLDKSDLAEIGQAIKSFRLGKLADWPCNVVRLMRSELRPEGSRYTCLAEVSLQ
jgi:2'-5' RNA ligase